jgi:hypothetical protein
MGAKQNFRVVVEPRRLGDLGSISISDSMACGGRIHLIEREYESRCQEIMADIKRHVDNAGYVSVEFDQQLVCEHCGDRWTEESQTYNGGCCSADERAHEEVG